MKDHPRLCGEKSWYLVFTQSCKGSPPPMRGKGRLGHEAYSCDRITPAYAGKRLLMLSASRSAADHPRLCGEKDRVIVEKIIFEGSPPPMRGKGCDNLAGYVCPGITPAYAGKSRRPCNRPLRRWDHPRLCGEKGIHNTSHICRMGSPPPMRGKDILYTLRYRGMRITPAYAGKSVVFLSFHFIP